MELVARLNPGEALGDRILKVEVQLSHLRDSDVEGVQVIQAILDDERGHHDRAALEMRQGTFWPRLLMPIVSGATEAVIWLGMKL